MLPMCKIWAKSKGSSFFTLTSILPLAANLWDASQNPSRVLIRRLGATVAGLCRVSLVLLG